VRVHKEEVTSAFGATDNERSAPDVAASPAASEVSTANTAAFLAVEKRLTCTPSHLRGTFSTAALMAASVFSTHCCLSCDDRATLMVKLLPPACNQHACSSSNGSVGVLEEPALLTCSLLHSFCGACFSSQLWDGTPPTRPCPGMQVKTHGAEACTICYSKRRTRPEEVCCLTGLAYLRCPVLARQPHRHWLLLLLKERLACTGRE